MNPQRSQALQFPQVSIWSLCLCFYPPLLLCIKNLFQSSAIPPHPYSLCFFLFLSHPLLSIGAVPLSSEWGSAAEWNREGVWIFLEPILIGLQSTVIFSFFSWVLACVCVCMCLCVCVHQLCSGCTMMLVDESSSVHHVTPWITAPLHGQSCNHQPLHPSFISSLTLSSLPYSPARLCQPYVTFFPPCCHLAISVQP